MSSLNLDTFASGVTMLNIYGAQSPMEKWEKFEKRSEFGSLNTDKKWFLVDGNIYSLNQDQMNTVTEKVKAFEETLTQINTQNNKNQDIQIELSAKRLAETAAEKADGNQPKSGKWKWQVLKVLTVVAMAVAAIGMAALSIAFLAGTAEITLPILIGGLVAGAVILGAAELTYMLCKSKTKPAPAPEEDETSSVVSDSASDIADLEDVTKGAEKA